MLVGEANVTICVYRNYPKRFLLLGLSEKKNIYTSVTVYISSHGGDSVNLCIFSARDRKYIDLPELVCHLPFMAGESTVSIYWDACRSGNSLYDSNYTMPPGPNILVHMASHRKIDVKQIHCLGEASFLESAYMKWFTALFYIRAFDQLTMTDPINQAVKLMMITTATNTTMFEYEMQRKPAEFSPLVLQNIQELHKNSMSLQSNFSPLNYANWKAVRSAALLTHIQGQVTELQKGLNVPKETILRMCRLTLQVYMNKKMRDTFRKRYSPIFRQLTSETCMEIDQMKLEDAMQKKSLATVVRIQ